MKHVIDFIRGIPKALEDSRVVMLLIDGLGTRRLSLPGFKVKTYETVSP